MTLQSMTGFAEAEAKSVNYTISMEIKSVNNRFRETRFKIPASLSAHEIELKKILNDFFSRGTFDIFISVKPAPHKSNFDYLDANKINQFINAISPVIKASGITAEVRLTDFLRPEFYSLVDENNQDELYELVTEAFNKVLVDLKKSRESEGEKLLKVLLKHLENFKFHFGIIEKNADRFKELVEDKLKKRVEDYKDLLEVDQNRLLQEVIYYLEKIDIHEEINRICAHLEKFENLLNLESEVGRQIDFLIQELNRETNTIGSKSTIKEISDAVILMKVQLEKIREQGLNIE